MRLKPYYVWLLTLLCLFTGVQGFSQNKPLFLENVGQVRDMKQKPVAGVLFQVSTAKGEMYITETGVSYTFHDHTSVDEIINPHDKTGRKIPKTLHYHLERMDIGLEHAHISRSQCTITYDTKSPALNFYFREKKTTGLHSIRQVIIHDIYPGIDWLIDTRPTDSLFSIRQDFILHPGADIRDLSFKYSRNARLEIDQAGRIHIQSRLGEVTEASPIVFERESKKKVPMTVMRNGQHLVYQMAEPKIKKETVIDPDLYWGTALTSNVTGANRTDYLFGKDVETDAMGNIVTIVTTSESIPFPTLNPGNGAYFQDYVLAAQGTMIISKFSRQGVLLWSTYFGQQTAGTTLAIDHNANIFAAGTLQEPASSVPFQNNGGYYDATGSFSFLTKFSPSGQLLWCTTFGTIECEISRMICDSKNNLYLSGVTYPLSFPKKDFGSGAYYFNGAGTTSDPFIAEFTPTQQLVWSTMMHGMAYYSDPERLAVDPSDNIYYMNDSVRMFNTSHQETWADATVGWPYLQDIACDRQGNVFVTGFGPTGVPVTDPGGGAYIDHTPTIGNSMGFILKYNAAHTLVWSTPILTQSMAMLRRVTMDQKCDAIHVTGVMNLFPVNATTVNNACAGGFYYPSPTINFAPVLLSFKTSGKMIYSSFTNFPYNYWDMNLSTASDPFGAMIYLFGYIFPYSPVPAVTDPGGGAFVQTGPNNLALSSFLMKLVPSRMLSTLTVTTPTGGCSCNGSASINVSCGTAPFSYSWSTGDQTPSVSNLCSGDYTVTVTDDNCNDTTFHFTLAAAPESITGFTRDSISPHCKQADGSITINTVQGGTAPFSYAINGGAAQPGTQFPDLSAGKYSIEIKDARGCGYRDSVILQDKPGPDSIYSHFTAASCLGADGVLTIDSVHLGTSPFQFSIDNSSLSPQSNFTGLATGRYFLQVLDSAGCTLGDSATVAAAKPPNMANQVIVPDYCDQSDGKINIMAVNGGLAPYSYSLDGTNFRSVPAFDSLSAGGYSLSIRDANHCVLRDSVYIQKVAGPGSVAPQTQDAACDKTFGTLTSAIVQGGTTPYNYSLTDTAFSTRAFFDSLNAGAYILYVKDSAGCAVKDSFIIHQLLPTPVSIFPKDTTICYGQNITFSVLSAAGPAITNYSWDNGQGSDAVYTKTAAGKSPVIVSVYNADGCQTKDTSILTAKDCDSTADHCVIFPDAFTPNHDGKNDAFGPLVNCSVSNYRLNIFNRWGELVFTTATPLVKWDGYFRGQLQLQGNYVYSCSYYFGKVAKVKKGSFLLIR